MTGADFVGNQCYGVSFNYDNNDNSFLYTIDEQTGEYQKIGQTGLSLQGFAYDGQNEIAYACSTGSLYTIDLATAAPTLVGSFGDPSIGVVDIAIDNEGHMYGLDIGHDALVSIDTATGAATSIGSVGIGLEYAQDIAYDRDNGILYGTLYVPGGTKGLYSFNTSTGAATLEYACAVQMDGFAIPYTVTEGNCIVPGCTTTIGAGGFTDFTMIGEETYYHISTAAQLAHISEHLDLNYIQTADIELSTYTNGFWTPIGGFGDPDNYNIPGYFTGKYLGNGHKIENLNIFFNDTEQNAVYAGVFAELSGKDASVSDLTVTVAGVDITAYNYTYCGAVAGAVYGGSITDCHAVYLGDVDASYTEGEGRHGTPNGYIGGIAGYANQQWDSEIGRYFPAAIDGCSVTFSAGSLLADGWSKWAGGIVGSGETPMTNCSVIIGEGEMIRSPNAGGIVGMMYAKTSSTAIENCTVSGAGSIALIIYIFGWLIKYKKVTWLISGFNTASKEKQEKYDKEKLCKIFGNFLFILASIYLFWGISLLIFPQYTDLIIWCGFVSSFIAIVIGMVYMNSGNKLKK